MARTHNQVRIIGGKWKRRKLAFPDRPDLRPTLDRARETLFSWLAPDLPASRCLDLFAGSGALGFEAASRGAAFVTLVEQDTLVMRALQQSCRDLGAKECQPVRAAAIPWLKKQQRAWDIVFLDPPFKSTLATEAIEILLAQQLLHSSSLLVVESDPKQALDFAQLEILKDKTTGSSRIQILSLL